MIAEHERLHSAALSCTACPLASTRTQVVFARGAPEAKLWLIGEAPGAEEDEQGQPFVGRAGDLLDKILKAAGIGQDEVFITNTVLCRPPGNRAPTADELAACAVHRDALLDLWKPPLIVLLGATAARVFLGGDRLADLRGRRIERDGRAYYPTFHPAYLLRDPSKKALAWQDWQKIRDDFKTVVAKPEGNAEPPSSEPDPSEDAYRLLVPLIEHFIDTPQGQGRLIQVFHDRSGVVLDSRPQKVTYFPTAALARLLGQKRAV